MHQGSLSILLAAAMICLWVVGVYLVIVTSGAHRRRSSLGDLQTVAWLILLCATAATFWVLWDRLSPLWKLILESIR